MNNVCSMATLIKMAWGFARLPGTKGRVLEVPGVRGKAKFGTVRVPNWGMRTKIRCAKLSLLYLRGK